MDAPQTTQEPQAPDEKKETRLGQAMLDLLQLEALADKIMVLLRRDLLLGKEREGRLE